MENIYVLTKLIVLMSLIKSYTLKNIYNLFKSHEKLRWLDLVIDRNLRVLQHFRSKMHL